MQPYLKILIIPFLVLFLAAGSAMGYTINDDYWGAEPSHSWSDRDVIGTGFDIDRMNVDFSAGLKVEIYTDYADNFGKYTTIAGDLFISTDGWNPVGIAPYVDDQFGTGEEWEYVLHITSGNNATDLGGQVDLYNVSDGSITMSYADTGYVYRAGQEVGFNPPNESLASGTWGVTNDYIWFSTNHNFGFTGDVGFHWTMSCGNDVIEGAAPVPEPATMLLLGTGLLGLASLGRRKLFKK